MAAEIEALVPSTRLQVVEVTSGDLTIAGETGHRHTLADVLIEGHTAGDYVDITHGGKVAGRLYSSKGDSTFLTKGSDSDYADSLIGFVKSLLPDWPLIYAAEDEDIVVSASGSFDHLIAIYYDDKPDDPIVKTHPGGSEAKIKPWIEFVTHSVAVTADGDYDLDNALTQKGYPKFVNETVVPTTTRYTLSLVGFAYTIAGASTPTYLHVMDEQTHLYDDTLRGLLVKGGDANTLIWDTRSRKVWSKVLENPHVFAGGHTVKLYFTADHDGTNNIAANTEYVLLVGVREGPGA